MPEALSPDRLQSLLSGGGEPRSAAERDALSLARRLQRINPPGPSAAEAHRLHVRFRSFTARDGRPAGVAGLLPAWLAAPAAQRIAAAAILLGGLSAGGSALGYTPVEAARDAGALAGSTTDLVVNIVRNLNPNRGDGNDSSAPGASQTPGAVDTPTPGAVDTTTPAADETAASRTVAPGATQEAAPTPTPGTPEPSPISGLQTISAGEAGSVDIRQTGIQLEIVSTAPAAGWSANIVVGSGEEVIVLFSNGPRSIELKVDTEDGRLDPEIEIDDDSDDDSSGSDDDNSGSGEDD
jgi:hypothetical protein